MAASLFRRVSSHLARLPRPLLPSVSLENPFAQSSPAAAPSLPHFSFGACMELMAVPKKKYLAFQVFVELLFDNITYGLCYKFIGVVVELSCLTSTAAVGIEGAVVPQVEKTILGNDKNQHA
ncbi:hypothetical protein COCNU_03G005560 [Cocos nucifera]|uniref:Uncharacterized protein n=1 Tax=Cocos nucifera TaxID=13894 RepID=A0A8K0MY45_COCNU|nr:hypothetical protein COCNU_03G005560 [Cocos nucifera]